MHMGFCFSILLVVASSVIILNLSLSNNMLTVETVWFKGILDRFCSHLVFGAIRLESNSFVLFKYHLSVGGNVVNGQ